MKICVYGIPGLTCGRINLADPRLDRIHRLIPADRKVYVQVDLLGEGGVPEADAIIAAPGKVLELILEDLEFAETRLGRNPAEVERRVLEHFREALERELPLCRASLDPELLAAADTHAWRTLKPVVESDQVTSEALLKAYHGAGFICFLTVGGKENRAWSIRRGETAWEAAGAIHTDIQKGFIRAEVIGFEDLVQAGGDVQAKRLGKQRLETKSYVVQDCDVLNFRFNK